MRPCGEVRVALLSAVTQLAGGGGAVNFKEAAAAAKVGLEAARETLRNMARAGQIRIVGNEKPAGSAHWHALYAPNVVDDLPPPCRGIKRLAEAVHLMAAVDQQ